MQGIEKRLEALGEKLGFQFVYTSEDEYDYAQIHVKDTNSSAGISYSVSGFMYSLIVYTNYVASFEESAEAEPKSFAEFIFSKEYNTDFEILTNHIIDTLVKDEE